MLTPLHRFGITVHEASLRLLMIGWYSAPGRLVAMNRHDEFTARRFVIVKMALRMQ